MEKKMVEELQKVVNNIKSAQQDKDADMERFYQDEFRTLTHFVEQVTGKKIMVSKWEVSLG